MVAQEIKVLLAEDDPLAQRAIAAYLSRAADLTLVGTASDGLAAVDMARRLQPQVALVDINMPRLGGIETTRRLTSTPLSCKVVCVTALADDMTLNRALDAGASGFLLKSDSPGLILHGIRAAYNGDALVSPKLVTGLLRERRTSSVAPPNLSENDVRLLGWLGQGMSNSEIAVKMHLATSTVKGYVSRLLTQLDLPNRTALASKAHEWGLVGPVHAMSDNEGDRA